MEQRVVTIIGGTGFLGRYVVRQLARAGYRLRVVARNPEAALHLKTAGDVGQIALIAGNLNDMSTIAPALKGAYAVVNLVGVLAEGGSQGFSRLHAQGAERLAFAAHIAGVQRFIHISALGVDKAQNSAYARSKLNGEKAVQAAFPNATILRPSVVFGAEDNFFNQFARMASLAPALPLIGGGKTTFQPVYVGDIAQAVETSLARADTAGETYELGGPHTYSFRQILEYILLLIGRSRLLVTIPFPLASLIGSVAQLLPRPPLTRDQVKLLKHHNVVGRDTKCFAHLGITPTAIEMVVPGYLARFHKKAVA